MVFAFRKLQEKFIEQRQDWYLLFIDLTKAFYTVCRPGLWSILSKLGCPPKFVKAVQSFRVGIMVSSKGAFWPQHFSVCCSARCSQLHYPRPTLSTRSSRGVSSFQFVEDYSPISNAKCRTDGRVFDLCHLKANIKVCKTLVHDFLFADDCTLAAHSEDDLQHLADCFSTTSTAYELTISIKKTEVLHQAAPGTSRPESSI